MRLGGIYDVSSSTTSVCSDFLFKLFRLHNTIQVITIQECSMPSFPNICMSLSYSEITFEYTHSALYLFYSPDSSGRNDNIVHMTTVGGGGVGQWCAPCGCAGHADMGRVFIYSAQPGRTADGVSPADWSIWPLADQLRHY